MKFALAVLALLMAVTGCSTTPTESERSDEPGPSPPGTAATGEPSRTAAAAPSTIDPAGLAIVHEYTDMFYRGEIEPLFAKFSDKMREILPLEEFVQLHEHAMKEYGQETEVIAEDAQVKDEHRGFVRWARFDKTEEIIEIQWILRADDTIGGFYIRPAPRRVRVEGDVEIQR